MDPNNIAQMAVGVVVGLAGIALGIQKLLKIWKETSTETSIIGIMRDELERMKVSIYK